MKTLLVIGAGASNDFDPEMGTGYNLINNIANRVIDEDNPPEKYFSIILNSMGYDYDQRREFSNKIRDFLNTPSSQGYSIDLFLNKYPKYYNIGRISIAFHIIGYEAASVRNNNDFFTKESWLKYLSRSIIDLKIITFNYDRLIEYYFYKYFKEKWIPFANNNIVHIYGKIGYLKWQNPQNYCDYGHPNNDKEKLKSIMNNFRLMYSDRNNNNHDLTKAKEFIIDAEKIIFIGFGFDEYNLNQLEVNNHSDNKQLIGSFYNNNEDARNKVLNYFNGKIQLVPMTCLQFVKDLKINY